MSSGLRTYGESLLRVPPLIVIDEIFRCSFGLISGKLLEFSTSEQVTNAPVVPLKRILNPYVPNTNFSTFGMVSDILGSLGFSSAVSSSLDSTTTINLEPLVKSSEQPFYDTSHFLHQNLVGINKLEVNEDVLRLAEVGICCGVFSIAVVVFLLSTQNLLKLYSYLISLSTFYFLLKLPLFPSAHFSIILNILIRLILANVHFKCLNWAYSQHDMVLKNLITNSKQTSMIDHRLVYVVYFLTGLVRLDPLIYSILILTLHYPFYPLIPQSFYFLNTSWNETKRIRNEYGISHLVQTETTRLNLNQVFRIFWISRAVYVGFNAVNGKENMDYEEIFRTVMVNGSETLTCIIGLTFTVSSICHQIGALLTTILYWNWGDAIEGDANRFGSISTVLFLILSLQTGITTLQPDKRLDRLFKNVVLLGTALFHAIHQLVSPLLHAFRTFQGIQIRAVVLSVLFLLGSMISIVYLNNCVPLSTWSLAVIALGCEFIIKISITLLISNVVYLSQRVEYPSVFRKIGIILRTVLPTNIYHYLAQRHDELSHEDVIFYLKSISHITEFITGIFLFGNAGWIFIFESTSSIRGIGMGIHAYFNIWCEGKKGLRVYRQRRTASQKIDSLSDATPSELLSRRDDVCAICYEEMESAKITKCGHYFHAVCLRQWLYIQNTCPLCHEILYHEENRGENNEDPVEDDAEEDEESEGEGDEQFNELSTASEDEPESDGGYVLIRAQRRRMRISTSPQGHSSTNNNTSHNQGNLENSNNPGNSRGRWHNPRTAS